MAAYLWEGYKDITCSQQRFVESSSLAGCIHFAAERSTLSHSGIQMFHDRWRMEAILRPLTISFYVNSSLHQIIAAAGYVLSKSDVRQLFRGRIPIFL